MPDLPGEEGGGQIEGGEEPAAPGDPLIAGQRQEEVEREGGESGPAHGGEAIPAPAFVGVGRRVDEGIGEGPDDEGEAQKSEQAIGGGARVGAEHVAGEIQGDEGSRDGQQRERVHGCTTCGAGGPMLARGYTGEGALGN